MQPYLLYKAKKYTCATIEKEKHQNQPEDTKRAGGRCQIAPMRLAKGANSVPSQHQNQKANLPFDFNGFCDEKVTPNGAKSPSLCAKRCQIAPKRPANGANSAANQHQNQKANLPFDFYGFCDEKVTTNGAKSPPLCAKRCQQASTNQVNLHI
jgi:hypothetical protein